MGLMLLFLLLLTLLVVLIITIAIIDDIPVVAALIILDRPRLLPATVTGAAVESPGAKTPGGNRLSRGRYSIARSRFYGKESALYVGALAKIAAEKQTTDKPPVAAAK
jgi:hypothetical protein